MDMKWYEDELERIAQDFDVFSKKVAARTAGQPPAVRLGQNAILVGLLQRMVESLTETAGPYPEIVEYFRHIVQTTYDRIQVVTGLPAPQRLDNTGPKN